MSTTIAVANIVKQSIELLNRFEAFLSENGIDTDEEVVQEMFEAYRHSVDERVNRLSELSAMRETNIAYTQIQEAEKKAAVAEARAEVAYDLASIVFRGPQIRRTYSENHLHNQDDKGYMTTGSETTSHKLD